MEGSTQTGEELMNYGELKTDILKSEVPDSEESGAEHEEIFGDTSFDNKKTQIEMRDPNKKTQKGKEKPSWVKKFKDFFD